VRDKDFGDEEPLLDEDREIDWDEVARLQAAYDYIATIEDPIIRLRAASDLLEGVE